ncbi:MAG: ECF transporter S component [Candidatus Asgardarchaeia archaeon]
MQTKLRALDIAFMAIMTPLVTILTYLFIIPIPETHGYFNLGEIGVYIAAVLFGPIVGAFAGGVGSALADVISGYVIYAPATLVIKGAEGFIVGYLTTSLKKFNVTKKQIVGSFGAILFGALLIPIYITAALPIWIWGVYILLFVILIALTVVKVSTEELQMIVSMAIGGVIMILGYFTYEQFVLGYPAIIEVPWNIMQMIAGITGGLIVSKIVKISLDAMGISLQQDISEQ